MTILPEEATFSVVDGRPHLGVRASRWRDEWTRQAAADGVTSLSFRWAPGGDFRFLRDLPQLEALYITAEKPGQLAPVTELAQLRTLGVELASSARGTLDWSGLARLQDLTIDWKPSLRALTELPNVRALRISGFGEDDLSAVQASAELTLLDVQGSRRLKTLEGIERFANLLELRLTYLSQLEGLAPAGSLARLRRLDVTTCRRIGAIDALAELNELAYVGLKNCGRVNSVRALASLPTLETFIAWESTDVVDGDLSPLAEHPALREIAMRSRRHYSPSVEAVAEALRARWPTGYVTIAERAKLRRSRTLLSDPVRIATT